MKSLARALAVSLLAAIARGILGKYRPQIVMVTGSVGKTSTKDAIAAALSHRLFIRASEKSYNSEIGVPLTVIGAKSPWTNPFAWMKVMLDGLALLFFRRAYPELLVLEVGADHPGDLARILSVATPTAVVVTRLPEVPVHVEAYASPEEVREEEFSPALALPHGAPLIYSADDPYAAALAASTHAARSTYGYAKNATVRLDRAEFLTEGVPGMRAIAYVKGEEYAIVAPGVIGTQQLYAPAAALATALALGQMPSDALKGLESYVPPPGRARIFTGKKGTTLIDDSYNASPAAVEEALNSLALVKGAVRRVAILGDMLELGRFSIAEHERIGRYAAERCDLLITVGTRARVMQSAAVGVDMPESHVLSFARAEEAADYMDRALDTGDVVLVKGSQGVRMERVVARLLEDPADRKNLVRQDAEWKRR